MSGNSTPFQPTELSKRWSKPARVCAFLALLIGVTGFAGWIFDIDALTRLHPSLVSMKFNTALSLMIAASCLWCMQKDDLGQYRYFVQGGGVFIAGIGLLTLSEHAFHVDFGIDELIFKETAERAGRSFPGRMGIASSIVFFLLGTAFFLLPKKKRAASICALLAAGVTLLIFLIYFYEIEPAKTNFSLTIALHTVVAFFALSIGILLTQPDTGLMRSMLSDTPGGIIARRLLPSTFFLTIFLGWLRTLGRTNGLFGPGFGTAIFVLIIILVFGGLIWWTAQAINREETDRKRAEAALRESEAQLRFVSDHAPLSLIHCDVKGRYKFVNAPYAEQFGLRPEQIVGKFIPDIVGKPAYESQRSHVESALRGQRVDFEEKIHFKNLGLRWVHGVYVPQKELNGTVTGFIAVLQDVTHRKAAEEALQKSEENFRVMADNISPFAWMANPDGEIFFFNKRWYEFTGTTAEEMHGWGWEKVQHPDHRTRVGQKWKLHLQKGENWEDIFPLCGKDGNYRWFLSRAFPIRDEQGNITRWFGTNTDIDDQKRSEEKLEITVAERTADLRETNEQLEAFVYSIAHDLRAPLRAMQGFSQILIDDHATSLDDSARNYLLRIGNSAEFMDRMIIDLLAFGRAGRIDVQLEPVALKTAWDAAIFQNSLQIEQTDCSIKAVMPLPTVLANEATLTQVLANLLSNAIKFTPSGTRPEVRLWAEENGSIVRLWLQDNGVGISPGQHERVFRVFERLAGARFPGTGIGLSIVKKGIERMGGKVGLESEPGKGSRFWIELKKS